ADRKLTRELLEERDAEEWQRRNHEEHFDSRRKRGRGQFGDLVAQRTGREVDGRRGARPEGAARPAVEDQNAVARSIDLVVPVNRRLAAVETEELVDLVQRGSVVC